MFEFSDTMKRQENSVLLVDALNLAFRYMHRKQLDFQEEYIATLHSIARSYKCEKIILASDRGTSTYRKEILPEYKENRKEKRKDQTEEEKAFFNQFFSNFTDMLDELSHTTPVFVSQGIEADDIAAYIVKNREQYGIEHICLLSSDKDWDLLVDTNIFRFSYVTRKEVRANNWDEHYPIPRSKYLDFKILTGDTSDNVPGIKGIGPKRAQTLLDKYGSVERIYDSLPLPGKYVYIQNLNNNADTLPLNERLFNILGYCNEALGDYTGVIDAALGQR